MSIHTGQAADYTDQAQEIGGLSAVVPVIGRISDDSLYHEVRAACGEVTVLRAGDCVSPKFIRGVFVEAEQLALTL